MHPSSLDYVFLGMAKTDFKTIDEYHSTFPPEIAERMQQIREIVHDVAPGAQEVISYQIPAFRYGKKGFLIYYSAYAKHISLSSPWTQAFLKHFEADLQGLTVSRSAIQFPHEKPLPLDLIREMVAFRKDEQGG
jgi:uncharacterized protein YdhG (YjbR/CyaY superfamily)